MKKKNKKIRKTGNITQNPFLILFLVQQITVDA